MVKTYGGSGRDRAENVLVDAFGRLTVNAPPKLDTKCTECERSNVTLPLASIYSVS